ncbi:NAD(P)-binding protein [Piscinibacter koreensis]|uniref:NAD(P)/FAD-dependent oxidoreductase n=1 Tax=Piscinibacter koreensis TaxID=2742824 RepID=A0A7Y6TUL5_9BURK|nr:NAD(P)/FAD-dependent oxidoreductase [Schlegelella koreensis]
MDAAARAQPPERGVGGAADASEVDVVIVGAGLSGIGAAAHLQDRCPDERFVILEARDAIGGTWDLFRYPGIRSDSDMHTLGYAFRPWPDATAIADGASIRRYIVDTAAERGIDRAIRFGHRVVRADWSSARQRWTLAVERANGPPIEIACRFVWFCSGYYLYDRAHRPHFAGEERFDGRWVHPQFWPDDLDLAGRRVVVIGSGATAVTLVPELARHAAHVTMLQRSPTWIIALPSRDRIAERLRRVLPAGLAYRLVRAKNVLLGMLFFRLARRWPAAIGRRLVAEVQRRLPGHDVATHFTPRYGPWDQRLCVAPDGDLFAAIRSGRADVVTDRIESVGEKDIRLASGRSLEADVIVTATGLELEVLGGVGVSIDGRMIDPASTVAYKGTLFSGVPNLALTFGYTNASWTLKADLSARYVCRLLRHMRRHGLASARPRIDANVETRPFLDLTSGYVQRALDRLPRQGSKPPWRLHQNVLRDALMLRGRIDDGTLEFERDSQPARR